MNMTEKIVFFSCTILFSLIMAITPVSATAIVSIADISSNPGETVTMPISIDNVTDYGTGTISVTYDPSVVHVTDVASGPASMVVAWNPDNTTGIVNISAWNTGGVSGDIVFANVTFHAVGSAGSSTPLNISVTTLKDISPQDITAIIKNGSFTIEAEQPLIPFLISGHVFYENGSECNNPHMKITNLNTSEEWQAETNATSNYYQLVLATGADVNATEILKFNAMSTDGSHSKVFNHAITPEDINKGGLFNFNISLNVAPPSPCFIATAAYGTPLHEDINILRKFRNVVLSTNMPGKALVETYYLTSPPIANALATNNDLRASVRVLLLTPLVHFAGITLNGSLFALIIAFLAGAFVISLYPSRKYGVLAGILKAVGLGILSIAVLTSLVFTLGWLGYTYTVCATIAAYILPLIIPLSIAVVVIAVIMPKYKKRDMRKRSRGKREEVENEELC